MTSLAAQQRERSRRVIPREELRRGVCFEDETITWKQSWHERESYAFCAPGKEIYCDECSHQILPCTIFTLGTRNVYPDAPVPVAGRDIAHLRCEEFRYEMEKGGKTEAELLTALVQREGASIASWAGWADLPEDERRRYAAMAGIDDALIHVKPPLEGTTWVITGSFGGGGDDRKLTIERLGGRVVETIGKRTEITHLLLGASGTTMYGQATGKGSKKYKEAMKKKAAVIEAAAFDAAVANFDKEGVPIPFCGASAGAAPAPPPPKAAAERRRRGAPARSPSSPACETAASPTAAAEQAMAAGGEPAADHKSEEDPKAEEKKDAKAEEKMPKPPDADEALEELPRARLQALAKKHHIRANQTSAAIIGELKRARCSAAEEDGEEH